MGDFNEVLALEERKGGSVFTRRIKDFYEWIQQMDVLDLPLIARKYTWIKGNSCSRLD